jgi:hypothetical protein
MLFCVRAVWLFFLAFRRFPIAALATASLFLASPAALAAPNLTVDFSGLGPDGTATLGDSLTLSIVANEIPAGSGGAGLFGFGFDLSFDDSILSATPAAAGPLWDGAGFSDASSTASSVGLSANRFFFNSGPSGDDILLATIEFTALVTGFSPLDLTWYTGGAGDNMLFDFTTLDTSPNFFADGSLTVISIVPEPSTSILIGLGLAGLGARRGCRGA